MENIKLNKKQFEYLNEEDCWGVFVEKRDTLWKTLSSDDQCNFHHHVFDQEKTDELFADYTYVEVRPDDTMWGITADSETYISKAEGVYDESLKVSHII